MESAAQQGKEDGGPQRYYDSRGEFGWVAEDRGWTSHSKQEAAGKEGVFEKVYVVS